MTKWYECAAEMLQNQELKKLKNIEQNYETKVEAVKQEVEALKQVKVKLESHQDTLINEHDNQLDEVRKQLQAAEANA